MSTASIQLARIMETLTFSWKGSMCTSMKLQVLYFVKSIVSSNILVSSHHKEGGVYDLYFVIFGLF